MEKNLRDGCRDQRFTEEKGEMHRSKEKVLLDEPTVAPYFLEYAGALFCFM